MFLYTNEAVSLQIRVMISRPSREILYNFALSNVLFRTTLVIGIQGLIYVWNLQGLTTLKSIFY